MFFSHRSLPRNWLHSRYIYDLLVVTLGFPASFLFVYRVDLILRPRLRLPDALFVAFYVYLVLVALLAFRLLFNYSKWIFPKLEFPTREQVGPRRHKALIVIIGLTALSLVVESFLKMIGFPFL